MVISVIYNYNQLATDTLNRIGINQLNSFLDLLKENGFTIGIQTYKDITDLLPVSNPASFKNYFAALVCKNAEQQEFFSQLFDNYFNTKTPPTPPTPNYKKIIIAGILLLVIGLIVWWCRDHQDSKPGVITYTPEKVISIPYRNYQGVKQPLYLDSLINKQDRIPGLQIEAKLNGENIKGGVADFNTLGKNKLAVTLQTENKSVDTTFYYEDIYIAHQKHLSITSDTGSEKLRKNQDVTYTSAIDTSITVKPYWIVNKDTLEGSVKGNQSSVTTWFENAGENTVTIQYDIEKDSVLKKFPREFYSDTFTQNVFSDYTIDAESAPTPVTSYTVNALYTTLLLMLFLVFITVAALCGVIYRRKAPKVIQDKKNRLQFTGNQKPFNLAFRDKEMNISNKGDLLRIAKELKKQIQGDVFSVDKKHTIKKTIQNNGLLTVVEQAKSRQRQYLILINEEYTNSQQLKLFKYLVNKLLVERVIIDFYFYHKTPLSFYTDHHTAAFSINQLHDMHYNADLIVMSKGIEFLSFSKPEIDATLKNQFSYWEKRILVTPLSQIDWSHNELYLKGFFSIVPADIEGLMSLVQLLNDQIEISQIGRLNNQYKSKFIDYEDIPSLKKYLKNDELLFQWICALACFPRLDWNVILAIGNLILGKHYPINYMLLLRIVRIDWMHSGSMPSNLRFNLLKELSRENELKTRTLLIELLNDYPVDETMFSFEEKRVNEINNNFILYASNEKQDEKTKSDHELFIDIYSQKRILDFSLLKYLEKNEADIKKDGKEWKTPILDEDKQNVGITNYINNITTSKDKERKKWLKTAIVFLVLSALPLIALALVNNFKKELYASRFNKNLKIIDAQLAPASLTFVNNECSNALARNPEDNTLYLIKNSQDSVKIPLNKKNTFPLQDAGELKIYAKIGRDLIAYDISASKDSTYTIRINGEECQPEAATGIYLQFYPENLRKKTEKFKQALKAKKYEVADGIDYQKANSTSEVRYFDKKSRKIAEQLAGEASAFFGQKIQAVAMAATAEGSKKPIEIWVKGNFRVAVISPVSTSPIFKWFKSKPDQSYEIKLTKGDVDEAEINHIYYNKNTVTINEVKELAISLIKSGVRFKRIEGVTVFEDKDFEIGNYPYYKKDYADLTENDIRNNVFEKEVDLCKSARINSNNYVIYFKKDQSTFSGTSGALLKEIVNKAKNSPNIKINITWQSNSLIKSDKNSNSIKQYFIDKGLNPDKIVDARNRGTTFKSEVCDEKAEISITKIKSAPNGYVYYGYDENDGWAKGNFTNITRGGQFPEVGDILQANNPVNIREKEIQKTDENGFENAGLLGTLEKGAKIRVVEVIKVAGNYIWVKFSSDLNAGGNGNVVRKPSANILWLDDHPENNVEVIKYLAGKGITVTTVKTNSAAISLVDKNEYNFIITDIGRDKLESGMYDNQKGGVEFVSKVKYNKSKILICSPEQTINLYKAELQKNGIQHFYSDFGELQQFIVENTNKTGSDSKR